MRREALFLVCALVASGCGAEHETSDEVEPGGQVVATVGTETITAGQVESLLAETQHSFEVQDRPFPAQGTPYYLDLRDQAVRHLTERSARRQEADRLAVHIDEGAIDRELESVPPQDLDEEMRRTGVTREGVRASVRERIIDRETFRAIVGSADEQDNLDEPNRRWRERINSLLQGARYASGWRPADRPRAPTPPELQDLPEPNGPCDLKEGTFTFREAWAHGCAREWGGGIPGRDGPPCPDVPVDSFLLGGFTAEEVDIGFERWEDNAQVCVPYPPAKFTLRTDPGACFPVEVDDPCMKGRVRQTWITEG